MERGQNGDSEKLVGAEINIAIAKREDGTGKTAVNGSQSPSKC